LSSAESNDDTQHLTVHPIIESHILLKLRKHPSVKHLHLPDFIITLLGPSFEPTAPSSMTMTFALIDKVENRLCSSKAVAEAVRATIAWVMGEEGAKLGIRQMGKGNKADSGMSGSSRGARKASGTKLNDQEALEEAEEEDEDEDVELEGSKGARRNILGNRNADDEVSEADEAADAAGWGSGSILGDEDDEESGHRDGLPSASSDEDEPAIPLSVSKRPKPRPPSRTRSKPLPKSSTGLITSSTFLPTLSTGFTLGDSDSDPDLDRDPDGIVGTQKAERKNRRGQRARQAFVFPSYQRSVVLTRGRIWEKKFGKNAKHVIKAKEEERNGPVGNGWGLSRGPRGGAQGVEQAGGREMAPVPIGDGFAPRSAASTARQPPPPDTSKKGLHPSWEAARIKRAREGAAAPKATKIVFD